jgi:hypothetical protein
MNPTMNTLRLSRLVPALAALGLATACAALDLDSGDLPIEDGAGIGKADGVGLELTRIFPAIDHDRLDRGGRAIITSAASWEKYFGTPAPAEVDFDREWVAFYGAGLRSTGGFSAEILGVHHLAEIGGLLVETRHRSPGFDCIVTQAMTWPHTVVKFDIPAPAPTWAAGDHEDRVHSCSPTSEERQAELAESRALWEQARAAHGDSYRYAQEFFSFLGFSFRTQIVVEAGVVTERHYKDQLHDLVNTWSEFGDEVGSHAQGHAPVILGALYDECQGEVLTKDPDENFINLTFDEAGLLQVCTYFPRHCADDCSRGPVITSIELGSSR